MTLPNEELQVAWAHEAEVRPRTEMTLEHLLTHTDNPLLRKIAAQYTRGLLTAAEVETKIREILDTLETTR